MCALNSFDIAEECIEHFTFANALSGVNAVKSEYRQWNACEFNLMKRAFL